MRTTSNRSNNLTLVRQVFRCFTDGDIDGLLTMLHPDVRAHPSIDGGPVLSGRDAVAEWWKGFDGLGGDLEARPLDFELRDDFVIVRGYRRHREGRTLSESQVFWLYELRDGLIRRMETHPSREAALAACVPAAADGDGAVPAPADGA